MAVFVKLVATSTPPAALDAGPRRPADRRAGGELGPFVMNTREEIMTAQRTTRRMGSLPDRA
jgi:hypothetical protein